MKKALKKIIFIFIVLIIVFFFVKSIEYIYFSENLTNITLDRSYSTEEEDNIIYNTEEEIEEIMSDNYPIKNTFSLVATGDCLIHSPIYSAAKTDYGYDFSSMLTLVSDYIEDYDVKYINQETVFGSGTYSGYPLFNTPSEIGDNLIDAGFNLFSLATNHSYDQFTSGALSHIEYWNSQEGIGFAGMNSSSDRSYYIEKVNGITYAFLSYTEHLNGFELPEDYDYLIDVYSYELAETDIKYLEDKVDVIIVAMHWGDEYTSEPNDSQREIANDLANLGVDLIIGSHPHWLQPIEYIGDTLVLYSLGNFLSNQVSLMYDSYYTNSVAVGALVSLDINKYTYEDYEEIVIDNIVVELLYNYRSSSYEYLVVPFSQMNSSYDSNYVAIYEKHKERMTLYSDEVYVNPIA